jgi:hypothetical protein
VQLVELDPGALRLDERGADRQRLDAERSRRGLPTAAVEIDARLNALLIFVSASSGSWRRLVASLPRASLTSDSPFTIPAPVSSSRSFAISSACFFASAAAAFVRPALRSFSSPWRFSAPVAVSVASASCCLASRACTIASRTVCTPLLTPSSVRWNAELPTTASAASVACSWKDVFIPPSCSDMSFADAAAPLKESPTFGILLAAS